MRKRRRVIVGIIIGGLLVLAGVAVLFQWQGWIPASCMIVVGVAEGLGIFLLVRTLKRNAQFARRGEGQRSVVLFGVAVFLILFGIGLTMATFNVFPVIPDLGWSLGAFLIAIGATFIYRALVLPNSNTRQKGEDDV